VRDARPWPERAAAALCCLFAHGSPPMTDLRKKFETAAKDAQKLRKRPSDDDMLRLYATYKQATSGDATGDRPGAFDFVARAKFDAWARLKGTDKDKAMKSYVDLVERLTKLG
jgi:diazepam-binding inhibitor (GABA receptor modulating acyl-CoA-binding protein)